MSDNPSCSKKVEVYEKAEIAVLQLEDDGGNPIRIENEESVHDNSQQASSTTAVGDLDDDDVNEEVIRTFLL